MDTRVEELANVVYEHAERKADLLYVEQGKTRGDRYHSYRRIATLCTEILQVLEDYRTDHPEEYESVKRHLVGRPQRKDA